MYWFRTGKIKRVQQNTAQLKASLYKINVLGHDNKNNLLMK